MKKARKPNANNEFLLEAHNSIEHPSRYTIYDMTQFLPSKKSLKRAEYMSVVSHTICGQNNTIHIINAEGTLSEGDAEKLAIAWFNGVTK